MGERTSGTAGFQPPRANVPGLPDLDEVLSIGSVELPEAAPLELPAAPPHDLGGNATAPAPAPAPAAGLVPVAQAAGLVAAAAEPDAVVAAPGLPPLSGTLSEFDAAGDLLQDGDIVGALQTLHAGGDEIEAALAAARQDPAGTVGVIAQRMADAAGDDPSFQRVALRAERFAHDPRIASAVGAVASRLDDAQRQRLSQLGSGLRQHAANLMDGEITRDDVRQAFDGVRGAARDGSAVLSPAVRSAVGAKAGAVAPSARRKGAGRLGVVLTIAVVVGMIVFGIAQSMRSDDDLFGSDPGDSDPIVIDEGQDPSADESAGDDGDAAVGGDEDAFLALLDRADQPAGGIPLEQNATERIAFAVRGDWTLSEDYGDGTVDYDSADHPSCYLSVSRGDIGGYSEVDSDAEETSYYIDTDIDASNAIETAYLPIDGGGSAEVVLQSDGSIGEAVRAMPAAGNRIDAYLDCGDEDPLPLMRETLMLTAE